MARIKMPAARSKAQEITVEEAFNIFLTDSAARGLAEKALKTYRNHLYCIIAFPFTLTFLIAYIAKQTSQTAKRGLLQNVHFAAGPFGIISIFMGDTL